MTENVENLVLEHLRAIRTTQAEHGERLVQIELQLSALGQQMGGLTTAASVGWVERSWHGVDDGMTTPMGRETHQLRRR